MKYIIVTCFDLLHFLINIPYSPGTAASPTPSYPPLELKPSWSPVPFSKASHHGFLIGRAGPGAQRLRPGLRHPHGRVPGPAPPRRGSAGAKRLRWGGRGCLLASRRWPSECMLCAHLEQRCGRHCLGPQGQRLRFQFHLLSRGVPRTCPRAADLAATR